MVRRACNFHLFPCDALYNTRSWCGNQQPFKAAGLKLGDAFKNLKNLYQPDFYMGVLDGSSAEANIIKVGPVSNFNVPPKVVPDPDRRSLTKQEWMNEFFDTSTLPAGHGFYANRWLEKELIDGQAAGQLMIIAAHIPIAVEAENSEMEWWLSPINAVKTFISPDPIHAPERGFRPVETSSLRDFPQ